MQVSSRWKPASSRVSTCISLNSVVMSEYLDFTSFPGSEIAVGQGCSCLQQAEGMVHNEPELVCVLGPLRWWVHVARDPIKVTGRVGATSAHWFFKVSIFAGPPLGPVQEPGRCWKTLCLPSMRQWHACR